MLCLPHRKPGDYRSSNECFERFCYLLPEAEDIFAVTAARTMKIEDLKEVDISRVST